MNRTNIKWSEDEIKIISEHFLSLNGMSNRKKAYQTWEDLYNNNNRFGYFRSKENVYNYITKLIRDGKINKPYAYKNPPKGFYLIPNTKWHYINKEMQILNLRTGKIIKPHKCNKSIQRVTMSDYIKLDKSIHRAYVETFLDPNKPYQIQENGIPIQTEKMKRRGWNYLPKKSYNEWLKKSK